MSRPLSIIGMILLWSAVASPEAGAAGRKAAVTQAGPVARATGRGMISVFGTASPTREQRALARHVGFYLAQRGYTVLNGGFGGVMEDVSRGARRGGGLVIGIMPGKKTGEANPWVDIELPTGLGELRNTVLAAAGEGAIAIGASPGTTSEVAWALRQAKIVVAPRGHVQRFSGLHLVTVPKAGGRRFQKAARAMVDEVVGRVEEARATRAKAERLKAKREARELRKLEALMTALTSSGSAGAAR